MTGRLDRIEAILENTATQQAKNIDEIDTLIGAAATNESAIQTFTTNVDRVTANVQKLVSKVDESDERFNVLRLEAAEDRQETRRLFNDAITQMTVDRTEYRQTFDAAIARMDADREEGRRRFDAQQENIQRLFVEPINVSRDNSRLRDRVDNLE